MTNPFYDPYRVLLKVYGEGARLKLALANTDLEELNRARTVKTVYGVLEHDAYLTRCIAAFAQKTPKQSVRILLKIALYTLIYLEKPRYYVADTAVELVKKLGKGGMAGFVNAFLRKFDEAKVTLPAGAEGLSVRSNYPLFAVERILTQYGARAESILFAKSHGVTVRFERGEEAYLSRPHEKTPFAHMYIFPHFVRDEGFSRGDYTFQSVGSAAICSVVEPCENLLDACAAPGGKSVLLAKKCQNVTACELHPHRTALIESYLSRMGTENVRAETCDSTVFRPAWEGKFQGVLCDVPCSGLGTLAENPDLALNKREEDLNGLNEAQAAILNNCARYVAPHGHLYYSTCSLLREENDEIVSAFLQSHPDFEVCAADCPLDHVKTRYGLQFLPDTAFGAGFYVSKLRRKV